MGQCVKVLHNAIAAASMPTTPPASAIAWVGSGPAGATPVLWAAVIDPDPDPDGVGEAPDPEGVWEASAEGRREDTPVTPTRRIVSYASNSCTSLCFQVLVYAVLNKPDSE